MAYSAADMRADAERWDREAARDEASAQEAEGDMADLLRTNARNATEIARRLRETADAKDAADHREREADAAQGDRPPTNPADQIGDAVEEVEGATAEVAEATAEAGHPEVAEALEGSVIEHLDAAVEEVAEAQEEVETVAEAVEEATPPHTPEGEAATEAVEAAEQADDAVEEAEDAVREVARPAAPEVAPDTEHWYFKSRFRRRAKAGKS